MSVILKSKVLNDEIESLEKKTGYSIWTTSLGIDSGVAGVIMWDLFL